MSQEVLYTVEDRIALITLNRPDRLNAMTPTMCDQLRDALQQADHDPKVCVAVLTGAGRGFCAGADIGRLQSVASGGEGGQSSPVPPPPDRYRFISEFSKPLIACLNGATAGIGLVVALQCDMRWAANDATLVTSFSRRGLIAEYGAAFMLERLVGPAAAADLLFSARKLSGADAATMGLVNRAEPAETLLASVRAYAHMLATEVSPRSLAVMKRQIYAAQQQTFAQALALAGEEMAKSFKSADFKEGLAHFTEKRAAQFTGQ